MKVTLESSDMKEAVLCQLDKMGINMNDYYISDLSYNVKRDGKGSITVEVNIEKNIEDKNSSNHELFE